MKITKRQLKRIIREASPYTSVERGMAGSYQAGYKQGEAGEPPKKTRDPEYLRGYEKGEQAARETYELGPKRQQYSDDLAMSGGDWYDDEAGYETLADKKFADSQIREMKVTRRRLRRIIKEGRGSIGDMFAEAASALEQRDGEAIEQIERDMHDLMIPEDQRQSYAQALRAMAEAAYELQAYEEEGY